MPAYRGASSIVGIYRGATPITAVYRGAALLWSTDVIRDDFNRPDTDNLSDDGTWADHSTSTVYYAGIVDNACRMAIPDGLPGLGLRTSRKRYTVDTASGDDGYIEVRAAMTGSATAFAGTVHVTQVFGRLSNSSFTNGIGIQLDLSTIRIVRRASGADTVVVPDCGTFAAGDRIRLKFTGNVHTLTCNGSFRGEWTGATGGAGFRSLGIRVDGSKDFLGPRRFSPALDYVEYGP